MASAASKNVHVVLRQSIGLKIAKWETCDPPEGTPGAIYVCKLPESHETQTTEYYIIYLD